MLRLTGHGLAIALLTLVTQIGGLAYGLALLLRRVFLGRSEGPAALRLLLLFLLCYGLGSLATTHLAPAFGRVALPCWQDGRQPLSLASPLYCLLNRHYVTSDLYDLATALAKDMAAKQPGSRTLVLDANFPFFDGFPLLPHLSHDDGRKLDLAFFYEGPGGRAEPGALRSPLGYWAFEEPRPGEPQPCAGRKERLSLRWDMAWFQPLVRDDLVLDETRTRAALDWLTTEGKAYGLEKILLEPHLKTRLGITSDLVRFQGCRAARHDDHIHLQIR